MPTPETSSVLVVCTGNICRSPVAQVLLSTEPGFRQGGVRVRSAGTHAMVGAPMEDTMQTLLDGAGSSSPLRFVARQANVSMITASDLVLTMTREQRSWVVSTCPSAVRHTYTLREFALLVAHEQLPPVDLSDAVVDRSRLLGRSDDLDIDDPFRRSLRRHRKAFTQIQDAVHTIGEALVAGRLVVTGPQ